MKQIGLQGRSFIQKVDSDDKVIGKAQNLGPFCVYRMFNVGRLKGERLSGFEKQSVRVLGGNV